MIGGLLKLRTSCVVIGHTQKAFVKLRLCGSALSNATHFVSYKALGRGLRVCFYAKGLSGISPWA